MPADVLNLHEMSCSDPRHLQVIALRIGGKRWSEIAADLGITYRQLCRWREEHPEIDAAIVEESMDFLIASRHRMAKLMPLADQAIEDSLASHNEARDRLSGAKMVRETFKPAVGVQTSAPIPERGRLSDDELDRVLDAS